MYTHKDQTMHHHNNKSSPREPSRTFHSFPLAESAPSALPNFNFPKRDILFGCTRSKSLIFNPNRVRNLNRPGPTTTQVGLGVVGDLVRAPTNTNKNLLLRTLVTTHLPMINHRARPASPTRPDGPHSRVPNGDLHQPSNNNNNNRGNRTRMSSDRVLVDEDSIELVNSPRKKVKRSEGLFDVVKNDESPLYPTSAFMRYCFGCEKKLKHSENIYIYRGEMAFCSNECREREVFIQDKMKKRSDQASTSTSRMITRKPTFQDLRDG